MFFAFHMRWVLMPLSRITWANLNHTLCGVKNDPFYVYLELGEHYYLCGDLYLMLGCFVGHCINVPLVWTALKLFGKEKKDKKA